MHISVCRTKGTEAYSTPISGAPVQNGPRSCGAGALAGLYDRLIYAVACMTSMAETIVIQPCRSYRGRAERRLGPSLWRPSDGDAYQINQSCSPASSGAQRRARLLVITDRWGVIAIRCEPLDQNPAHRCLEWTPRQRARSVLSRANMPSKAPHTTKKSPAYTRTTTPAAMSIATTAIVITSIGLHGPPSCSRVRAPVELTPGTSALFRRG